MSLVTVFHRRPAVSSTNAGGAPRVRAVPLGDNLGIEIVPHPTLVTLVFSILRFLLPAASAVLTNELWALGISVSTRTGPRQVGSWLFDKFQIRSARYLKC